MESTLKGSCVIFWHEDYQRIHRDVPLGVSFVQAVDRSQVKALHPGDVLDERKFCRVEFEGREHRCLLLTIEPQRSLMDQYIVVGRDKRHLEDRAIRYMSSLEPPPPPPPPPTVHRQVFAALPPLRPSAFPPSPAQSMESSTEVSTPVPPAPQDVRSTLPKPRFAIATLRWTKPPTVPAAVTPSPEVPLPDVSRKTPSRVCFVASPGPSSRAKRSASRPREDYDDAGSSTQDNAEGDEAYTSRQALRASVIALRTRSKSVEPVSLKSALKASPQQPKYWATKKIHHTDLEFNNNDDNNSNEEESVPEIQGSVSDVDLEALNQELNQRANSVKQAVAIAMNAFFTEDEILYGFCVTRKRVGTEQSTLQLDRTKLRQMCTVVANWRKEQIGHDDKSFNLTHMYKMCREHKERRRKERGLSVAPTKKQKTRK